MIKRALLKPSYSFFLFGPRGTGKSFWLNYEFPNAIFIDFLDKENCRSYLAKPERLIELVEGHLKERQAFTVVLDEVQKVPEILDSVHFVMNRYPQIQFVLTGSSTRKIKRQSNMNLLGGRAILKHMHPFTAFELGEKFNLQEALVNGLVPLIVEHSSPEDILRSYVGVYLEEEIKSEGFVRNLSGFARFLEAISFSHGCILNTTNVAQECQVSRTTVNGFVEILEDLLLGFQIQAFTKKSHRRIFNQPKFYYFDAGVYRSLRPKGKYDRPEEIDGCALEGLVAQHLRAWIDYSKAQNKLFYWKTYNGQEVDFIIYGENEFYALEVKNNSKIKNEYFSGLKAFSKSYPDAKLFLLYRGSEILLKENILCIPCENFLKILQPDIFPFV